MNPPDQADLSRLRELLDAHFNEEELRTLCFDMGLDYDNLPGRGKSGQARELVAYCKRHGNLKELVTQVRALRPTISWEGTGGVGEKPSHELVVNYATGVKKWALGLRDNMWGGLYSPLHGEYLLTTTLARLVGNRLHVPLGVNAVQPLTEIIKQNSHLVIVGDAGSGKTTTLLEILRQEANKIIDDNSYERLPVYVPLAQMDPQHDLLDVIKERLSMFGLHLAKNSIDKLLASGDFTFLFDGANEIHYDLREQVERQLLRFTHEYPRNDYYLTCRPHRYLLDMQQEIQTVLVQPLSIEGVIHFVHAYLRTDQADKFIRLMGIMKYERGLRNPTPHIFRNPLFLRMSIQVFSQSEDVVWKVITRGSILKLFINTLLFDREERIPNKYSAHLKVELLSSLAFDMLSEGRILVMTDEFALTSFRKTLKNVSSWTDKGGAPRELLEEILLNGLLRRVELGKVEWMHQRIQEFFAAEKLAALFTKKANIISQLNDDEWKDVVVFVASTLSDDMVEPFITEVFRGWHNIGDFIQLAVRTSQRAVLAGRVLKAAEARVTEQFQQQIGQEIQRKLHAVGWVQAEWAVQQQIGQEIQRKSSLLLRRRFLNVVEWVLFNLRPLTIILGEYLLQLHRTNYSIQLGLWLIATSRNDLHVEKVAKYLGSANRAVRWVAAYCLCLIRSPKAVDDLLMFLEDHDGDVRWIVVHALVQIGDKKAIGPLLQVVENGNPEDRKIFERALRALEAGEFERWA